LGKKMAHYQVLIGGGAFPLREFPFTSLSYERSFSLRAQPFSVTIPVIENVASLEGVQINRDDDLVYEGKIYEIEKFIDPRLGKHFYLRGFDLKHKLPFLPSIGEEYFELWGRPSGTELKNHVNDQLANSDLTAGTLDNTTKTYPVIFGTPNSKFNRRQAILAICEITGWECFVQPNGTLDFQSQIQTDRTATIRFKRGELLQSWIEPYKVLIGQKVEKITVVGHNIGDLMATGSAQTGGYTSASREKTIPFRHIKVNAACVDSATALLADWQNDVNYGKFEAVDAFEGHAYEVGDLIKVADDEFGVDGNYRVFWIGRSVDATRAETTKIGITNVSKLTLNGPYLLNPGEQKLINACMGVDEFGKIHHLPDTSSLTTFLVTRQLFHDSFAEINTGIWEKSLTGAASDVTASVEDGLPCAKFVTDANTNDHATLQTINAHWGNSGHNWRFATLLKTSSDSNIRVRFQAYDPATADMIEFRFMNGTLYAHCWEPPDHSDATIGAMSFSSQYRKLMFEKFGTTKVNFYVDDVLEATLTTYIPTTNLKILLHAETLTTASKEMYARHVVAQLMA